MYAVSQTTVLYIKRLYNTESSIFLLVCVLCFQRQPIRYLFYLLTFCMICKIDKMFPNCIIISITKTCLYNIDPLKPHFYIVKLGFTGVYILFFLFLLKNIDCGYSLEPPRRGGSNEYQQSMFWAEIWKISDFFYLKMFSFWRWNFPYIRIEMFS